MSLDVLEVARKVEAELDQTLVLGSAGTGVLEGLKREARGNYHSYVQFVLRDVKGKRIRQASIHRTWYAHITACWAAGRHPGILAPWGHGKTNQLVVGLPTWLVGHDQSLRAKVVCNNDAKAMERVMGISTVLRSPHYRIVFPTVRAVPLAKVAKTGQQNKWTQHEIFLDRPGFSLDATFQAAGVLSGGIGGRCDLMIFDDCVDQKNAIDHPAERERVINNIDHVWMSRMEPDARLLYVGTPWHQADYSHQILERSAWCVLRQSISEDFKRIEMEVYNPPPGYPLPAAHGHRFPTYTVQKGNGEVRVLSSNIDSVRYDGAREEMVVTFKGGGAYSYEEVPQGVHQGFLEADSKGAFFARFIKGRYNHRRLDV